MVTSAKIFRFVFKLRITEHLNHFRNKIH